MKGSSPMSRKDIPEGYAIVKLADQQWYPLQAERLYTSCYQDGFITFNCFFEGGEEYKEVSFSRQKEAVQFCQYEAAQEQRREWERWEQKAIASNVYPERCIHYRDLIKSITKCPVYVSYHHDGVWVYASGYHCPGCGCFHEPVEVKALVVEDALETCTNVVYANQCDDGCRVTCCKPMIDDPHKMLDSALVSF
jgi:hypothetical protein